MQSFDLEAATPSLMFPEYLAGTHGNYTSEQSHALTHHASDLTFDLAFSDAYDQRTVPVVSGKSNSNSNRQTQTAEYVPQAGLKASQGLELLIESNSNGREMIELIDELKHRYNVAIPYTVQKHALDRVSKAAWFTNLNPKRTLPILVDHDQAGVTVRGSSAIVSYILLLHDPDSQLQ